LGSTSGDASDNNIYEEADAKDGLMRDPSQNPLMHNWNHIFVRYCDGGYFSGDRLEPEVVDGKELFYRGRYITEAIFTDLAPKLSTATDIVLSGCSAGAMRIIAHLDALRAMLPSAAKVVGYADSGFFMDVDAFTSSKKYLITGHNGTALFSPKCVRDHSAQPHKCLVASVASAYLETPLFAFQSRYDFDQLEGETTEACRGSDACVSTYGANLTAHVEANLVGPHGYFIDSCERHCWYHPGYAALIDTWGPKDDASDLTNLRAFAAWYDGGSATYSQAPVSSCKQCCNGKSTDRRLLSVSDVMI
jgi:hypothetical protein